jgi:hypothetical protein
VRDYLFTGPALEKRTEMSVGLNLGRIEPTRNHKLELGANVLFIIEQIYAF